jgi:cell wall-associated NlpC family hydrolase
VFVLTVGVACAVASSVRADTIGSKQAQARQVLAQLQSLDASAQRANNRYQQASLQLRKVEHQLAVNKQSLGVAKVNLRVAQVTLEQRLVSIYTTRDEQSTLSVILGANSLTDLVNRIETVKSVSRQDAAVIDQVVSFQHQIVTRRAFLRHAHTLQKHLVHERAVAKARIDSQVRREQRLYNSVKGELDHLLAAQRERQLAAARLAIARQSNANASDGFGISASAGGVSVAPPSQYTGVVGIAMRYLGVPYVWAGASPSGFDCSGLVMYVYAQVGVSLPHYTGAQWQLGVPVSRDQLEPGDLVFFDGIGHVGIYVGNGLFIHAPQTGDVVKISSLAEGYYAANYDGARRITG